MRYRILSLDGGGVWALIEAKALIALYGPDTEGHDVLREFDLVAANSAGSIVLGALAANLTLGKSLSLFEDERTLDDIFSPASLTDVLLNGLAEAFAALMPEDSSLNLTGIVPKYSTERKLAALKHVLAPGGKGVGDVPLPQAAARIPRHGPEDIHLLITAFDYDLNRALFFRSSETKGPQWGEGQASDVTLAQAIHASSTAPVSYFDKPAQFPHRRGRYWDGAITGCNNPVLAAVTEAVGKGQDPREVAVLSIGTATVALPRQEPGNPPSPFVQPILGSGIVPDLRKVATAIIDDPPDIATFLAHVMTGSGRGVKSPADSRIVRMNPLIAPVKKAGRLSAPGSMTPEEFDFLKKLGLDAIKKPEVDAIAGYADLWLKDAAPNQPIRMNGKTFKAEVGQGKFSEAEAAWEAIK
jgi:uncharacterized protein